MKTINIKKRAQKIKRIRLIRKSEAFMKLGAKIRAYLFTGILVTAPVAITFYMAYKFIFFVDGAVNKALPIQWQTQINSFLPFSIPGLGLIALIFALILVGMFTTGFLGRFVIRLGEWIVYKMPVISSIYSLLKQVFTTFFSNKSSAFNKVVLIQYPRHGLWTIAFVSGDLKGEIKHKLDKDMIAVFVPTTPNPTSGFLLFVKKEDVIELKMSVEDGLKFVVSGGLVEPEQK